MNNNDILRRLRYALNINDEKMIAIFKLADHDVSPEGLKEYLAKDTEENFTECTNRTVGDFLDGLITEKRGPRDSSAPPLQKPPRLTRNDFLKKIRIALEYKEEDMLEIMELGGMPISKSELSALFRKKGHKHYKACGGQLLRNFLNGLTEKLRA